MECNYNVDYTYVKPCTNKGIYITQSKKLRIKNQIKLEADKFASEYKVIQCFN